MRATIEAGREASAPRVLDVFFFFFSVLIDSKWRGKREREKEKRTGLWVIYPLRGNKERGGGR